MPESWRTRLARWGLNWFPAYRATGARICYIAADWSESASASPCVRARHVRPSRHVAV